MSLASFMFRKVLFTLIIATCLFWVVSSFVPILVAQLFPSGSGAAGGISGAFSGIPANIWYFLDMSAVSVGFPLLLTAYVTRFIVRRIPIIG